MDESPRNGEQPPEYVQRVAEAKALAIHAAADEIVLGADTTVVIDNVILGKPTDADDARRMLKLLSARRHDVLTGICLRRGAETPVRDYASTAVWFAALSDREIEEYAAGGEPMDKAGAYAIQGLASKFVERIEGCYFNVMGLPVALVYRHLRSQFR